MSRAIDSVCGAPIASSVTLIVTPAITPLTALSALRAVITPPTVTIASCAKSLCFQASPADVIADLPPLSSAVDWTASPDRPASSFTFETLMLITFALPDAVERSTRCAPSVPVTTVAVTPGLFFAELIAAAMPAGVLFVASMSIDVERSPSLSVSVPEPSVCFGSKPADTSVCERATCLTSTW
ncbi:Uncharacterised protein [Burkholderia pseudomallei]|nr:Uncharacterised protein [Burkholderia pseudomallei]